MTQIYCDFTDCINNEDKVCIAAAIRLSPKNCCLTYLSHENGIKEKSKEQGDKLLWDREFFEDDSLDDETAP